MDRRLEELVLYLAQALVDEPGAVSVTSSEQGDTSLIELKVARNDLGKVIGRQGRMARSLRLIVAATSMKLGKHSHLEIVG